MNHADGTLEKAVLIGPFSLSYYFTLASYATLLTVHASH